MKAGKFLIAIWFLATVGLMWWGHASVHAQTATAPFTIQAAGPSSNCPAPATGITLICFTTDKGMIQSINGAAYVAPTSAGVTSFNGQTGAITYTPPAAPVTSVNGKTGAVTLSLQ
jgi:hypothetical protein